MTIKLKMALTGTGFLGLRTLVHRFMGFFLNLEDNYKVDSEDDYYLTNFY